MIVVDLDTVGGSFLVTVVAVTSAIFSIQALVSGLLSLFLFLRFITFDQSIDLGSVLPRLVRLLMPLSFLSLGSVVVLLLVVVVVVVVVVTALAYVFAPGHSVKSSSRIDTSGLVILIENFACSLSKF